MINLNSILKKALLEYRRGLEKNKKYKEKKYLKAIRELEYTIFNEVKEHGLFSGCHMEIDDINVERFQREVKEAGLYSVIVRVGYKFSIVNVKLKEVENAKN